MECGRRGNGWREDKISDKKKGMEKGKEERNRVRGEKGKILQRTFKTDEYFYICLVYVLGLLLCQRLSKS